MGVNTERGIGEGEHMQEEKEQSIDSPKGSKAMRLVKNELKTAILRFAFKFSFLCFLDSCFLILRSFLSVFSLFPPPPASPCCVILLAEMSACIYKD